jgi:hypothetical protein
MKGDRFEQKVAKEAKEEGRGPWQGARLGGEAVAWGGRAISTCDQFRRPLGKGQTEEPLVVGSWGGFWG